ncbi:hypothetical protein PR048_010915 [Dryococelus australis]|uniref:ShKT domain-containing protein n=1 Tax=Dryococelus australis TaxID=614101 RepID=A0ABQ9I585_9NEOP|nr:hypothetical protein PR048_010915 [Dryococelus australis]
MLVLVKKKLFAVNTHMWNTWPEPLHSKGTYKLCQTPTKRRGCLPEASCKTHNYYAYSRNYGCNIAKKQKPSSCSEVCQKPA